MNKTKIDWADYTWNPVTGCYHGCEYCYARRIAERFGQVPCQNGNCNICGDCEMEPSFKCERYSQYEKIHDLETPVYTFNPKRMQPYPFGFEPTFHRYRLDEPKKLKKPSKIFVVSMGDLFGDWVPDEWVGEVLKACQAAPQHQYLFLTKNPYRYGEFKFPKNCWCGTTITCMKDILKALPVFKKPNHFISLEPLLDNVDFNVFEGGYSGLGWLIIGAQTGPGAVPPKPEWVQNIIDQARAAGVPIFLKDNLNWPEKIQEWPGGLK